LENFLSGYNTAFATTLLGILGFITLLSVVYSLNHYMRQRQKNHLAVFLERFGSASCVLEETDIPFDESMSRPLLLLAKAFESSGEFHKSISIYLYLLRGGENDALLEHLGRLYLNAGLLERAESIFLQILSQQPRHIPVLYKLGSVYEMMKSYDKAIATLEPLETLKEEVGELRAFWYFEKYQQDPTLSKNEKIAALLQLLQVTPSLYRLVIGMLFHLDPSLGWAHLRETKLKEVLDLLWYLPASQLDFAIIDNSIALTKIYVARGDIVDPDPSLAEKKSASNSIDILVAARISGEERGGLAFSYLCTQCKQSHPIAFRRCPECLAINSAQLEERISSEETDHTLF